VIREARDAVVGAVLLVGVAALVADGITPPAEPAATTVPLATTTTVSVPPGDGFHALPPHREVRWVANVAAYDAWYRAAVYTAAVEEARAAEAARQVEIRESRNANPVAPSGSVWDRLAQCESGGDWSINSGNGYYGGLQFTLQSWRGVGGTGYPHQHTRAEQIHRAERLLALQGWGAWPGCSRQLGLR
jgi:hypothetical protein